MIAAARLCRGLPSIEPRCLLIINCDPDIILIDSLAFVDANGYFYSNIVLFYVDPFLFENIRWRSRVEWKRGGGGGGGDQCLQMMMPQTHL